MIHYFPTFSQNSIKSAICSNAMHILVRYSIFSTDEKKINLAERWRCRNSITKHMIVAKDQKTSAECCSPNKIILKKWL